MKIKKGGIDLREETFKNSYKDTIKENIGLSVYNTGFQQCEAGYTWGPAVRDHYLIHYISSGKGQYCCDGQVYELSAGDLFLVYPLKIVSYTADEDSPWEYIWVGFNGGDSSRLLEMTDFTRDHPVIYCEEADFRYKEILMRIYEQRGSQPWNDTEMTGILYHFFSELIRQSHTHGNKRSYSRAYVENALRFIECNYTSDISVADIARYIRISRSHLYKLFTEVMGTSPKDYLMNFRLNQACGLLRNGDMTISQVSASVGFKDPLYFARIFKKNRGMTPGEMKKSGSFVL